MTVNIYEFDWNGIRISLKHVHNYFAMIEHLEIKSIDPEKAPLPITDTGYKSHFIDKASIECHGNAMDYVLAWLDEVAKAPKWQGQKESANQYSLF